MMQNEVFFPDQKLELEVVEAGKVCRKIRARGGDIMMVEVFFETGGIGYEHDHPHEQVCYCLSGEFMFTIGTESLKMGPGDSAYVPASARHGATCISTGRLLDVFTPQREDFLAR